MSSGLLDTLKIEPGRYGICTIHRSETTDDPERLRRVVSYVEQTSGGVPVIFPMHPRTRQALARNGIEPKSLMMIDPVGYFDLHRLLSGATLVLTDSGGLQKEAYFHRVPSITLRDDTEWMETIEAGWNRLWTAPDFTTPRREIADFGDGHAAELIVEQLRTFLGARQSTP
jgi:UDP-GlcNAc3NAcA epimerase